MRETLARAGIAVGNHVPLDGDNFKGRVHRASLPVLPLAFALAQAVGQIEAYMRREMPHDLERHGVPLPGTDRQVVFQGLLGALLNDGAFQDKLLGQAEKIEAVQLCARDLKPGRLVRVRLDGAACIAAPLLPFVPMNATAGLPASAQPITIDLPAGASPAQLAIMLLATLADPPRSACDRDWQRTVTAFCRVTWERRCGAAPERADDLQPVVPAQLTMPLATAQRIVTGAMRRVACRIGAAEVLGPAVQALAHQQDPRPPHGAGTWSLAAEIRRIIAREAGRVAVCKGQPCPGYRSPYPTGKHALANFETRVTGPGRSVVHLAIGLRLRARALGR